MNQPLHLSFTQILATGINEHPKLARYAEEEQEGTLFGGSKRTPEERAAWIEQDRARWEALKHEHPEEIATLVAYAVGHRSHLLPGMNAVGGVTVVLPLFPEKLIPVIQLLPPLSPERLARLKAKADELAAKSPFKTGFPPTRRTVSSEEIEEGARLWCEALSGNPWYAAKTKRSEELTGDPMYFWRLYFSSGVNMLPRPRGRVKDT